MRTVTFIASLAAALCLGVWARALGQMQPEDAAAAPPPGVQTAACLAEPVVLRRFGRPEPQLVSLTDCEQRPNPEALPLISALAAPAPRPPADTPAEGTAVQDGAAEDGSEPPVQLDPRLLVRLQQIASRFPDRAIEIVSGFRIRARATSRHFTGQALDLRVEGVDNEELSIFARTLEQTGVGYYPNSTFVHIDVRDASAYWVDRSAPGERPDYVRQPPGASAAPDAVLAATPPDAEQDILSAPLARALLDVHGPELPVHEESEPSEPSEPSEQEAAPPSQAVDPIADPLAAGPPPAAQGSDAAPDPAPAHAAEDAAQPGSGEEVDPARLDAELESLLERALVVMREANAAG